MKKGLLLFVLILLLTACNNPNNSNKNNATSDANNHNTENITENNVDSSAESKEEITELLVAFPDEQVERIITTSVPIAEMLHTLDITPVGVPTSNNPLPTDFTSIDQIGSPMAPDLEMITNLDPDLIISASSLEGTLEASLEGMDFNRVYLPTDSLSDLKVSFETLGTYFDKQTAMESKLQSIANKEKALQDAMKDETLPTVLLMIGTSDDFMVMSEESYLGSLIQTVGAENIATTELNVTETYAPINLENIVTVDPDIIFVLSSLDHGASKDMFDKEVEKNEAWKKLSAYQNEQIHLLDYETFGVTSIQNIEKALTEIADYFVQ